MTERNPIKCRLRNASLVLSIIALVGCNSAGADTEPTGTPAPTVDVTATEEAVEEHVLAAVRSYSPTDLQDLLSDTYIPSDVMPLFVECGYGDVGTDPDGHPYLRMNLSWDDLEQNEEMEVGGVRFDVEDQWDMALTYYFYPTSAMASDKLDAFQNEGMRSIRVFRDLSGSYNGVATTPIGFGMQDSGGAAAMQVGSVLITAWTFYSSSHLDPLVYSPNDLAPNLVRAGVTHLEQVMLEDVDAIPAASQVADYDPPSGSVDFTLTDVNAEPMAISELHGKVVLLYFGYTYCPDFCPMTLTEFHRVKQDLGDQTDDVAFVMVSVDPTRDTPERMKEYLGLFDPEFIGLTGTEEELTPILMEFGITSDEPASEATSSYVVEHSTNTYLLDREGKIQTEVAGVAPAEEMTQEVRYLLDSQAT